MFAHIKKTLNVIYSVTALLIPLFDNLDDSLFTKLSKFGNTPTHPWENDFNFHFWNIIV